MYIYISFSHGVNAHLDALLKPSGHPYLLQKRKKEKEKRTKRMNFVYIVELAFFYAKVYMSGNRDT